MGLETLSKVIAKPISEVSFKKLPSTLKKMVSPSALKLSKLVNKKTFFETKTLVLPKEKSSLKTVSKIMFGTKKAMYLTEDFALKKQRLISELTNVCDKRTIARIEKASTPEQLANILTNYQAAQWLNLEKIAPATILDKIPKGTMPLELEQAQYAMKKQLSKFVLAREKALHVPSKNPQVIAIENILKEQYGCKFVSLKDNEVLAKQVLRAFETASKNGVKLPQNVAVSDFMINETKGENVMGTLLFNPNQSGLASEWTSTTSNFHVPLHEIMHGEHPKLFAFSLKKIPKEMMSVKNNLSGYSRTSKTHETFTELNTKRLIDGLSPQEQELYNYLNILS